ncbi:hypothetical protein [Chromobacterium haemolyticum]|uniref:hypothetical protein n=1 Tax=Chromobacterium haemolyticum TaxID=394935 RepID=UPI0013B4677F|nr:hypothetical protein [Chromobacterium haemolyticum]
MTVEKKPMAVLGVPLREFVKEAEQAGLQEIQRRFKEGLPISGLDGSGRIILVYPTPPRLQ